MVNPIFRAAVALAVLSQASLAFAFSVGQSQGNVIRWKKLNVSYYLHPDGSADIGGTADLDMVRKGFQSWQSVPCTAITFSEAGFSSSKALTPLGYGTNGKNEVAWIEDANWKFGTYVLGVTSPVFYTDGSIIEADIALNGYQQKWSTNGASYTSDVLAVATHEEGHFIGMQHVLYGYSSADPPTMAPAVDPYGKTKDLNADDKQGVCYLYPKGTYACASDADCPYVVATNAQGEYYSSKIACQSGLCGGKSNGIPQGTQGLGEECGSDYDCKDSTAFCQTVGTGAGVCAVECTSPAANDCPAGLVCYGYSNGPGGVCLPDQGGGGQPTKGAGEPCSSGNECKSLLCVGTGGPTGTCRTQCQPGNDAACGAGNVCAKLQGTNVGACVEAEGPGDLKAAGEECQGGQECQSGLCVGSQDAALYHCADPCGAGASCPSGFACTPLQGGGGVCLEDTAGELGSACQSNLDCKSDVCITVTGPNAPANPFCTEPCGSCPCGMKCETFQGGESYCTPSAKVGCVPNGNPCGASSECTGGVCFGGLCADGCDVLEPSCPPGKLCKRLTTNEIAGVCAPPGTAQAGSACTEDGDCATLFCDATPEDKANGTKQCLIACNPADGLACGEAFECTPIKAGVGGCVPAPPDAPGGADAGSGGGDATTGVDAGGAAGDSGGGSAVPGGSDGSASSDASGFVPIPPSDSGSGGCGAGGTSPGTPWALLLLVLALLPRRRFL